MSLGRGRKPTGSGVQLEKSIVGTLMLMEQYLDGPEVDVDVVMSQGEAVYGILTDNWFEPWGPPSVFLNFFLPFSLTLPHRRRAIVHLA